MPRREILEFAKDLIAVFFVEIWHLKTEGVQISIFGPKFPTFSFKLRSKGDAHIPAREAPP